MEQLKAMDPDLAAIRSGDGVVMISPGFQGRILAALDGGLVHKFDFDLARNPKMGEFNNLGGNSLWPAPEGGAYAFNYLSDAPGWLVQEGINSERPAICEHTARRIVAEQRMTLRNRKNISVPMVRRREVSPLAPGELSNFAGVQATGYHSLEFFRFDQPQELGQFVLGAWSLEQFWLEPGVVAFGKIGGEMDKAVNCDFYGNPQPRLRYGDGFFTFALGGEDRLQIGLNRDARPELLGAYLPQSGTLLLRHTPVYADGTYINFADNDQPDGIFSASDAYSVFNGASLGFFELETLAPLDVAPDGRTTGSTLVSTTWILRGDFEKLDVILQKQFFLNLSQIMKQGAI